MFWMFKICGVSALTHALMYVLPCSKAVNREYEEFVLTVGDFDERVFLGADADEEIGTPRKTVTVALGCPGSAQKQLQQHMEKVCTLEY